MKSFRPGSGRGPLGGGRAAMPRRIVRHGPGGVGDPAVLPNPAPRRAAFLSSGERSAERLRFEAPPAYSAAVINFTGGDLVLQPIDSLGQLQPAPAEIIVVDDGSTDGDCPTPR
jgi:hypothetical protein